MLKYKFNMKDALKRVNFNTYKAKTSGLLSQDTLKKIKEENTDISLKALNNLCLILDMQPGSILDFVATDEEKEKYKNIQNITLQSNKNVIIYNCQEGNQMAIPRKGERRSMERMTDKQMQFIAWLITTATDKCQSMEEVREMNKEIRKHSKGLKAGEDEEEKAE